MFTLRMFGGPRPSLGFALASLGESLACVKCLGASATKSRNIVSRKNPLGWVNISVYNCFVGGSPKFTNFFAQQARKWKGYPYKNLGGQKRPKFGGIFDNFRVWSQYLRNGSVIRKSEKHLINNTSPIGRKINKIGELVH